MRNTELGPVVAIITANKDEKSALECALEEKGADKTSVDGQIVMRLPENNIQVVTAHLCDMGTLTAAATTRSIVHRFRPVCVLIVGVCGGNPEMGIHVRDLLVGTCGVYYEQVKEIIRPVTKCACCKEWRRSDEIEKDDVICKLCLATESEDDLDEKRAAAGVSCADLRSFEAKEIWKLRRFPAEGQADDRFLRLVRRTLLVNERKAKEANFLCGERYLSGESIHMLSRNCGSLFPTFDIHAVDMESGGIWRGCEDSNTRFLMIKGVSDTGDEDPTNRYHTDMTAQAIGAAVEWLWCLGEADLKRLISPILPDKEGFLDEEADRETDEQADEDEIEARKSILEQKRQESLQKKLRTLESTVTRCMAVFPGLYRNPSIARRLAENRTMYDAVLDESLTEYARKLRVRFFGDSNDDTRALLRMDPRGTSYLLVDSIDGVQNLAAGRTEVAISLAYGEGGTVQIGIIGLPYRTAVVTFETKIGASSRICLNGVPVDLDDSPAELSSAVVGVPGDFERLSAQGKIAERTAQLIALLAPEVGGLRISGSLAYDLASVALGELDARISTHATPADVAAGAYLIQKANGVVTDFTGKPWSVFSPSLTLVAARTEKIHTELVKHVKAFLSKESLPSGNGLKTYCPLDEAD